MKSAFFKADSLEPWQKLYESKEGEMLPSIESYAISSFIYRTKNNDITPARCRIVSDGIQLFATNIVTKDYFIVEAKSEGEDWRMFQSGPMRRKLSLCNDLSKLISDKFQIGEEESIEYAKSILKQVDKVAERKGIHLSYDRRRKISRALVNTLDDLAEKIISDIN